MSKISKAIGLAALGSAAMLVSGAGVAAGGAVLPGLFSIDQAGFSVVGGTVTAACPVGSTCTNLEGTGDGMLMRSIQAASGLVFMQAIVAENLAGGGLFANEQTVQQTFNAAGGGASNIAQKMVINDVAQGFNANHVFVGRQYAGFILTGNAAAGTDDPYFVLNQTINLGNGASSKVRIQGPINSGGGNVCDGNQTLATGAGAQGTGLGVCDVTNQPTTVNPRKVYIDQLGGPLEPEFGDFVYRWANTPAAFQNQTLDNGLGGVSTGATGTNVAALFISQATSAGEVSPSNRFGLLKYGTGVGATTLLGAANACGSIANPCGDTNNGTWTPTLVSTDTIAGNPYSNTISADPTDGYGTWGTGSVATNIFGALNNTADFSYAMP